MHVEIEHIDDLKKINNSVTAITINFYDGQITKEQFEIVKRFKYPISIKWVSVKFICLNDEKFDLKFLEQFTELEYLCLGEEDEGVVYGTDRCNLSDVKLAPTLLELSAVCCGIKNFKFLKNLKKLESLDLTANRINYLRKKDLPKSLKSFKFDWNYLYCRRFGWTDEKWYIRKNNVFSGLKNLEIFHLILNNFPSQLIFPTNVEDIYLEGFGKQIVLDLSNCPKLEWLKVGNLKFLENIFLSNKLKYLHSIDVSNTGLTKLEFIENTQIRNLVIDENQETYFKKIKKPETLKQVDIRGILNSVFEIF